MSYKPGQSIGLLITLADAETFKVLPGETVSVDEFNPAIGAFQPIGSSATDGAGQAGFTVTLPKDPGTYRYRPSWKGSDTHEADMGPEVKVVVKE